MPGSWSVVAPQATTNLIINPSFETNTAGWSVFGASALARVSDQQRRGVWCLRATPTIGGTSDGIQVAVPVTVGATYAISVDVLGAAGVGYRLDATLIGTSTTFFTGTGRWQRVSVVTTAISTGSMILKIIKDANTSIAPFWVDGMQCELGSVATTYCDGNQAGCAWTGVADTSTSIRSDQSRAGGQIVNLSVYGIRIQGIGGVGMPPIDVVALEYGYRDGSRYQNSIAKNRPITLQLLCEGLSLADLHSKRKAFINALKPNGVAVPQPIQFRYSGTGADEMCIAAVYDDGLQYNEPVGFVQQIALRLIAHDPFWRVDGEAGMTLGTAVNVANTNYIAQRGATGTWAALGTGMNLNIGALAVGTDGTLYAGGAFTTAGGVAAAGIGRWNGSAWSALGTGAAGGTVATLAVGADGAVYAGGFFTSMGGVANTARIAKWNGSAWSALGTGAAGGDVLALTIGPDGAVYAGGNFTSMGGVANTARIAKWNGSAWAALGTGADNQISALAVASDGTLYAGGTFATVGGVSATRIAKWNGSAWSALGTGANNGVTALAVGVDGTLYAGGSMSSLGGVAAAFIGRWNGSAWAALGTGLNNIPYALQVTADGTLYAGGAFTTAGGINLPDSVARWTGSAWVSGDINLPGTATVFALAHTKGVLTVGYNAAGNATAATTTTLINGGSATAYPRVVFAATSAAALYQLINTTTGQEIYFANLSMQAGETITIDCAPGVKTVTSSYRGTLLSAVAASSNLATFGLLPGANILSVFAESGISCQASWPIRHWSVDGGAL